MPYSSVSELPSQFSGLPDNAKRMAMHVINSVLKNNGSESSAFAQAWGAVKKSYHKEGSKWVANNASFTNSVGDFFVEVYNSDSDSLTFSYIAQTEGVHTDVSGKKIEYTPMVMLKSSPTFIGTKLSYDPSHEMKRSGKENERPVIADVVDSELIRINEDAITRYKLKPDLLGKYGIKNRAVSKDTGFNEQIRGGKLPYHSSELQFTGSIDDKGVHHPDNINYTGGILLKTEGADPGAVLMDIYNSKYGGTRMPEGNETDPAKELEQFKTEAENAKKEIEDLKKAAENAKSEYDKTVEEIKAQNATLEEKVKTLEAANNSADKTADEKVSELKKELDASNAKYEDLKKEFTASNAKVVEMVNEKRKSVLSEIVSNDKYVNDLISQNLSNDAFNAKLEEIKALKDEGKKEAEAASDTGISASYGAANASDAFKKEWGMTKEELDIALGVKST